MTKPLTKTEMKILIFNKINTLGMTYEEARAELSEELKQIHHTSFAVKKAILEVGDESSLPHNLKIKGGKNGRRTNERKRILPV